MSARRRLRLWIATFMADEMDRVLARLQAGEQKAEGLQTIRAFEGRIQCRASPGASIADVRRALLEVGLPDRLLDVYSADGALIPWPADDPMLMRAIPEDPPHQDPSDAADG